jgi:maltose alpha-D-glucosyltransferase/alpha-amylase
MNWMERMIRMRKEAPEIGWGEFNILPTQDQEVLALRYDWRNNSVVVVHNLSAVPREVRLDVGVKENARKEADRRDDDYLVNLIGADHSEADASGKHCFLLEPYGYRWFRVGGLDYILKRSEV